MGSRLKFDIDNQPDLFTCGPTCLQAVYRYHRDNLSLTQVIAETPRVENGGTMAVSLGSHALRRGYRATIYTWNLQVFDPSWFPAEKEQLAESLRQQMRIKEKPKIRSACKAYREFLELGGEIRLNDLNASMIRKYLKREIPILTGLSSTYLYQEPREFGPASLPDPIQGTPQGHFVVLCGYDSEERKVLIADPLHPNPLAPVKAPYEVPLDPVICAIMLGIMTYDANLLILQPA